MLVLGYTVSPQVRTGSARNSNRLLRTQVIFVGTAGAGKTSLIARFTAPDAEPDPKPTLALEYTYARR